MDLLEALDSISASAKGELFIHLKIFICIVLKMPQYKYNFFSIYWDSSKQGKTKYSVVIPLSLHTLGFLESITGSDQVYNGTVLCTQSSL